MNHAFYVYSAWGITAVVLVVMVGLIWLQSGQLQRDLKRLEAQGVRRRSAEPAAGDRA